MMNGKSSTGGLVILCEADGSIKEVLSNKLDDLDPIIPGEKIFDWVDIGSQEKMKLFIKGLQEGESAFDWELNVPTRARLVTLHFSGVANSEHVLIIAAENRSAVLQIYEDLMRINNDQVNALRSSLKEQSRVISELNQRDNKMYDQLSFLNNELIDLQRELFKKNVELEELNRQKNQFLGMAAHDLRSPLSAIMTYSGFLEEEAAPVLNEEQKEFLSIINKSSQFMRRLIEDLLDVSAIEAGQLSLFLQPTRLEELAAHAVKLNQALVGTQRRISFKCAAELPLVNIDRAKMEQVLNNLISNAVKYSQAGSDIHIELKQEGERLQLSVQDHGQGIAENEIVLLGKAFSKASSKSTTGEKSTGLGLAITYRIVQGHQGNIWAESKLGEGSTFFVTLPILDKKD